MNKIIHVPTTIHIKKENISFMPYLYQVIKPLVFDCVREVCKYPEEMLLQVKLSKPLNCQQGVTVLAVHWLHTTRKTFLSKLLLRTFRSTR